jgi:hypothetical protein
MINPYKWWQDPKQRIKVQIGWYLKTGDIAYDPTDAMYVHGIPITESIGQKYPRHKTPVYRKKIAKEIIHVIDKIKQPRPLFISGQ